MSLNHNQFDAVASLPGSEFAANPQLDAVIEYGGSVALRYLGERADIAGGAVAGEFIQDMADMPNAHTARPPAAPHEKQISDDDWGELRGIARLARGRADSQHAQREAADRARKELDELKQQRGES